MEIKEIKCPNCGGEAHFDIDKQKMVCSYCGFEFTEDIEFEKDTSSSAPEINIDENYYNESEKDGLKVYSCNSCGGEIIAEEQTAASFCPFCNNNVIIPSNLENELKPDYIIPFKVKKEEARNALDKFYKDKKLLPPEFKDRNRIRDISGIYVPVWLFSGASRGKAIFRATQVMFYSDGDYDYTETSYYSVIRDGDIDFKFVPVDGSEKLDNILMESLEPFLYEDMVDFSVNYLPGFLANRYDVGYKDVINEAENRIIDSTRYDFQNSVSGYASVSLISEDYKIDNLDIKYALVPVWFLNTEYNGTFYAFAMNGQTGKVIGDDLPVDQNLKRRKMLFAFLNSFIVFFIITFIILRLFW